MTARLLRMTLLHGVSNPYYSLQATKPEQKSSLKDRIPIWSLSPSRYSN